mgnify:CR=1 FL=1
MILPGISSPLRLLVGLEGLVGVLYVSLILEKGFVGFFSLNVGVVGLMSATVWIGVLGTVDAPVVKFGLNREMKSGRFIAGNPELGKVLALDTTGVEDRFSRSISAFSALILLVFTDVSRILLIVHSLFF